MRCSRKIHFCSGHRVLNHESKCANAHGHNYVAWVFAEAGQLDSIGRVIDFSVLKERVGGWVDKYWDHTMLIYEKDKDLLTCKNFMAVNKEVFICPFNPTAENMADYLIKEICPEVLKDTGVTVTKIVLYETENCFAEVRL